MNKRIATSPVENPTNSQKHKHKIAKMPVTLEDIMKELKKLEKLDSIEKTVTEINSRQTSVEQKVEENSNNINHIQTDLDLLQADVNRMNYEKIRNNIIIYGIPMKRDENHNEQAVLICNTLLNETLNSNNIITRRMPINSPAPPLVIHFRDLNTKITILRNWKDLQRKAEANPMEINIQQKLKNLFNITDTRNIISITEEQTQYSHKLFMETRKILGEKFRFIWLKYGTVHIRQSDGSAIHKIQSKNQLRQFMDFQEDGGDNNSMMNRSSY